MESKDSNVLAPQYSHGMEPLEFINANNLNFSEACVVKYITRWPFKNGSQDIYKSTHYCLLLLKEYFGLRQETINTIMRMLADYNNPQLSAGKEVLRAPNFSHINLLNVNGER